ncbi:MAG: Alpha-L-glutamate ligase-like protein [Parcubacteria group bacterium GW2011_GWA2_47_8]|nr:MAG: Alpha-L-glutamate ligase-like protein [Parcubacteria group bacterium GW2011_GWA2_47_8]
MNLLRYIVGGSDVLGMNARNLNYISAGDNREIRRTIDHKLLTKRALRKAGLPVAATYGIISSFHSLHDFDWAALPNSFVVKPNLGLGGRGIIVVYGKQKGSSNIWIKADHEPIDVAMLKTHVGNIIEGNFSLGSQPDKAFFEERVKIHPDLKPYVYRGVPDVRVIIYNGVPVMAMLRLPTKKSQGKANLEQGAVGAGIDMSTGITTSGIIGKGKIIIELPETRLKVAGIVIPGWHEVLSLAVQAQRAIGISFVGVDIAIDKDTGPKILELNVRPGLKVQLANLAPLRIRLEQVKVKKDTQVEQAVAIGQSLFGKTTNKEVDTHSGRTLIGIVEPVKLLYGKKDLKEFPVMAKVDTGAMSSSIDRGLAIKLGIDVKSAKTKFVRSAMGREQRSYIELMFKLRGEKVKAMVSLADRSKLAYKFLIGRRDLKKFLIDPQVKRKRGV